MAFQFPPKPWTDGQLFETENADGTSLVGIYNESKNLWSFERTTESGASSLVTTRDVRTLKTRPSVVPNPFDPNLDEFVNQQETNWFLWDAVQGVLLTSTVPPTAAPYNSFWFDEDQKVLYVWDEDQWVKAAPDADIFEGFVVNGDGTGSANDSGNITVKQSSTDAQTGRLYLKGSDNVTNISLYGAGGGIDMKGNLSFNSTSNNKNIRAYGSSSPVIRFLTGTESGNGQERMSISGSAVTSNVNLISNYGIAGQNIDASGQVSAGTSLVVGTTSSLTGNVTAGADLSVAGVLSTAGTTAALNSQVTIEAPSGNFLPGLALKTTNNTTTLWNAAQPGILQFETTPNTNGGSCGVFINGESSSPSFTLAIGAPGKSLDRVFSCSYSSTYGKRIYVYPNWGNSYTNAVNLPDATPVTLGYLRANGLVTIASTTATQEADDPSGPEHGAISAQTSVTVPSQMTLSADTDGGQGFTLKGKTVADPTSHNGDVLKTTHSASNTSAELEYFGSTAGANSVQTKTSVDAAIAAAAPEAPSWSFFNQNDTGVGSQLDGFWSVQYDYTAVEGRVIIKAKNESTNIANGTVVCNMPTASRPKSVAVIRLASREGTTTADAVFSAIDGNITIQNVQGVGSARLEGMLIYPIHDA